MCAYCEPNQSQKDIVAKAKQKTNTPFGGIVGNQLFVAGKTEWEDVYSMSLNVDYCPKCGRKLE